MQKAAAEFSREFRAEGPGALEVLLQALKMTVKNFELLTVRAVAIATLVSAFFLFSACTGDKNAPSSVKSELLSAKGVSANIACSPEEIGSFERTDGETIDLKRESLPRGLYLARDSELLIEKKSDTGFARAVVHEAAGGKTAEVVCAEGLEKIAPDSVDIAITGLVKFDTTQKASGTNITQRQFFFFQDKASFGAIFSNPKSLVTSAGPGDLKKLLSLPTQSAQLIRNSDHTYVLRYQRERDGVRARLLIHLDLVQ